jgi:hypothetical protein
MFFLPACNQTGGELRGKQVQNLCGPAAVNEEFYLIYTKLLAVWEVK